MAPIKKYVLLELRAQTHSANYIYMKKHVRRVLIRWLCHREAQTWTSSIHTGHTQSYSIH